MNFLAHFYLCSNDAALVAGNFLGDFVKGKKYQDFPDDIAQGILMHREIDAFTDAHADFLSSKHRLVPEYGHYAGVVTDMFYDYLLAYSWQQYSVQPIDQFIAKVYEQLRSYESYFPEKAHRVYYYMSHHDWLSGYTRLEGIQGALEGIARRSPYAPDMKQATEYFHLHFDSLYQEFQSFFPQVRQHVEPYLS